MTPIVRAVKKVSENKKNVDNHIRCFLYEKFKESDYISAVYMHLSVLKILL